MTVFLFSVGLILVMCAGGILCTGKYLWMYALCSLCGLAGLETSIYLRSLESRKQELLKRGIAEYYLDENKDKQWRIKDEHKNIWTKDRWEEGVK